MHFRAKQFFGFVGSVIDPRNYVHILRVIHYYGYSHVRQRRHASIGEGSRMAPNVSLRNGDRIKIGCHCHIGDHCYLWAGDSSATIVLGNDVSLGPGVFITASNYQYKSGNRFRDQPRHEQDVRVGDDVWLGTRAIVTAGVSIGAGCIIGAGAVVTKDLPAGSVAVGVPARIIGVRGKAVRKIHE